jgi:hypothetical protein
MKVTLGYYTVAKAETYYHVTDCVVDPRVLPRILAFGREKFSIDMTLLL